MVYIPECKKTAKNTDTSNCAPKIWAVVLLLSESRVIINDLDVILYGFMLDIIYITVFELKGQTISHCFE